MAMLVIFARVQIPARQPVAEYQPWEKEASVPANFHLCRNPAHGLLERLRRML